MSDEWAALHERRQQLEMQIEHHRDQINTMEDDICQERLAINLLFRERNELISQQWAIERRDDATLHARATNH